MTKVRIGTNEWRMKDIGEMILREYEKGEISTGRTYELMGELFDGRKEWNLDSIWENV